MLALCGSAAAHAPQAPAPSPRQNDPILEALRERLEERAGEALPPGATARLSLDVLDVVPGRGVRLLGKFSAPLDRTLPTRLQRRVALQARDGLDAAALALEVSVRPFLLGEARARFDIESRVRIAGSQQPHFVRALSEEVAAGRSVLFDAFQLPGTARRLMLTLSWRVEPAGPLEPARQVEREADPPMVDLRVELVRVEKGTDLPLRRQRLSVLLGAEARSLMRLVEDPWSPGGDQHLEVRLTPRSLDHRGLLLGIEVRGELEAAEDAPAIWIDHRDDARIGSGRRYSLVLGGEAGEEATYRLDILPEY